MSSKLSKRGDLVWVQDTSKAGGHYAFVLEKNLASGMVLIAAGTSAKIDGISPTLVVKDGEILGLSYPETYFFEKWIHWVPAGRISRNPRNGSWDDDRLADLRAAARRKFGC